MHRFLFISLIIIFVNPVFSQTIWNVHADSLDINQWQVYIPAAGSFFWDHQGISKTYIPKLQKRSPVFCHDLWVGALDNMDSLHVAAQRYLASGRDYYPGPVANSYDSIYDSRYNHVWKISRNEIESHVQNWQNAGYTVPASIQNWPGNGNNANGEPAFLAPFKDVNANGVYDPVNGDYPWISGDQALYTVYNDVRAPHGESGGDALGVDVNLLVWAYENNQSVLDSVFFMSYKIVNRSGEDYHDMTIGVFSDFDIGNAYDDYIGCDSTRNTFFGYNGDDEDGDGAGQSYGYHPPSFGIVFLKRDMNSFVAFNNSVGNMGMPVMDTAYYNYMTARWNDGTYLTYGGIGYGGGTSCHFMFSGDPVDNQGWSEVSEGTSPSDRRGIASHFIGDFHAGDEICLDLAFVFGCSGSQGDNIASVQVMKNNVDYVQDYYDNQIEDCNWWPNSFNEMPDYLETLLIYPNPASDYFIVEGEGLSNVEIFDITGKIINSEQCSGLMIHVDIASVTPGLYFVKVHNASGFITRKIIISR